MLVCSILHTATTKAAAAAAAAAAGIGVPPISRSARQFRAFSSYHSLCSTWRTCDGFRGSCSSTAKLGRILKGSYHTTDASFSTSLSSRSPPQPSSSPSPPSTSSDDENSSIDSSAAEPSPAPSGYMARLLDRLLARSNKESWLEDAMPIDTVIRSGVSAFFGIGCLTGLHYGPWLNDSWASGDITMVLGSFGATAVLVYGYPAAPFSQPKNVVLGHVFSAACGIAAHKYIAPLDLTSLSELSLGLCNLGEIATQGTPIIAAPVAVGAATMGMMALGIVHPPAGGTCLIACMGSDAIHALGWQFLVPAGFGSSFLCFTAFFINNASRNSRRQYPNEGWW